MELKARVKWLQDDMAVRTCIHQPSLTPGLTAVQLQGMGYRGPPIVTHAA